METTAAKKPHAVCLPFPAQGHLIPMFNIAIFLHHRGFHKTFVNSEYNRRRLIESRGGDGLASLPDFRFEEIPDGLPEASHADKTQDVPSLMLSTSKNCLSPFRDLLAKLNSSPENPPVTCVVSDAIMAFSLEAAAEIGVPVVCFRTTNACSFLCNKNIPLLMQNGLLPLKDEASEAKGHLDTALGWIPGLRNMRLIEFPSFVRTTDMNDPILNFVIQQTELSSKASAILFNTCEAMEPASVFAALAPLCPAWLYSVGPVHLYASQIPENQLNCLGFSLWKERSDQHYIHWLDSKKPNSVLYVNFGSITVLTRQQIVEFAWGLANSKVTFLWVLRSDLVIGDSAATSALPA